MTPKHGISLVVVPSSLVGVWVAEWNGSVVRPAGGSAIPAMRLFVEHSDKGPFVSSRVSTQQKIEMLDDDVVREVLKDGEQPAPTIKHRRPRQDASRNVIVTTVGCYEKHVQDKVLRSDVTWRRRKPNTVRTWDVRRRTERVVTVARAFQDEFHLVKGSDTRAVGWFRRWKTDYDAHLIFLSGTPAERGPSDLIGYIGALQVDSWLDEESDYYHCRTDAIRALEKQYSGLVRSGKEDSREDMAHVRTITAAWGEVLSSLMIRRTRDTTWIAGERLIRLPPQVVTNHSVRQPAAVLEHMRRFETEIATDMRADLRRRVRAWEEG
ncbi:MAG: hypothetical protein M4579_007548, partial [Chaenotheca gracillima]